jgi:hypothetical protein
MNVFETVDYKITVFVNDVVCESPIVFTINCKNSPLENVIYFISIYKQKLHLNSTLFKIPDTKLSLIKNKISCENPYETFVRKLHLFQHNEISLIAKNLDENSGKLCKKFNNLLKENYNYYAYKRGLAILNFFKGFAI